jgi:hypothetical protein
MIPARCFADSPRRGEYGALWLSQCDHQQQIAAERNFDARAEIFNILLTL